MIHIPKRVVTGTGSSNAIGAAGTLPSWARPDVVHAYPMRFVTASDLFYFLTFNPDGGFQINKRTMTTSIADSNFANTATENDLMGTASFMIDVEAP